MNREYLKGLGLEDDVVDKIMAAHGANVGELKQQVTTLTAEKAALTGQVDTYAEQVKTLKADADLTPELKKKVEAMEAEQAAAAEQNAAVKKSYEIDIALEKAGAKNAKAVRALLDQDAITLGEDGKTLGLTEQLEALKTGEDSSFLFHEQAATTTNEQPPKKPSITFSGNSSQNVNPNEVDPFNAALNRVMGK